jgi:hypothetical protein
MKALLISLATLTLGSCAVYSPTVPSTPLLEKGQTEITVATRSLVAWELDAAWSPASHLLLTAESAYRQNTTNTTTNGSNSSLLGQHRQAGLGIGAYRISKGSSPIYMAAVGGIGLASVNVYDSPIVGSFNHFQADYTRYYGQVYIASQGRLLSEGFSVRGTWVNYRQLLQEDVPIDTPVARFYLEPSVFVRIGRGPLQGMVTAGMSLPNVIDQDNDYHATLSPTSSLISVGLVVRPHLFKLWADK